MGTTTEKINYAINATNDIAEGINNIGGNITQNTELADFREELDKLYSELPKVTDEGTSITLENTKKGKLLLTPKGNVEQETTEGLNELSLANLNERTGDITLVKDKYGTITLNGTRSTTLLDLYIFGGAGNYVSVNLSQGTNYLKLDTNDINESFYVYVVKKASDETITNISVSNNNPQTSFEVNDGDRFRIFIRVFANKTLNDIFARIMISTMQNADYEPYTGKNPAPNPDYPQNVKVVKGNNTVKISGKNLFNKNGNIKNNYRLSTTGGNFLNNDYFISEFIPIEPSTTYSVNYTPDAYSRICYYTSNTGNPEHSFISKNDANSTFTTPNNAKYLRLCNSLTELDNIQLEQGSTATDYEPYIEPITKELNLGNIELAKIGDYSDLIFKNEKTNPYYDSNLIENAWYKKEKIKKVNGRDFVTNIYKFDKSTAYSDTTYLCCFNNNFKTVNDYVSGPLYCTHFDSKKHYAQEKIANNMYLGSSSLGICVLNTDFSSATELNEYFSENDIIAYLPKQTSSNIQITDTTLINQLEELNKVIGQGGTVIVETESEEENAQLIVNASALKNWEEEVNE